jgi:hypothetical protein
MPLARSLPWLAVLSAFSAISCGSSTAQGPNGIGGSSSTAGSSPAGASGGNNAGGSGTSIGGAEGKSGAGGVATSNGGTAAGVAPGGATNAGSGGSAGASTAGAGGSDLPDYAGPGVGCFMGYLDDKDNRCGVGQTCCQERLSRTECQPDIGSCAPCSKPGECTAISCDEPSDCPGGACCATLGTGGGGVEFARLTCQPSCSEGQYVICSTLADCPSEYHECGISSMLIHRCFH